ncbi:MAG: F0F1 ATP synthase subunit delta [Treponema sp.]|nr:F0F1 ATP synthase subunit delta [Treponema sp.]
MFITVSGEAANEVFLCLKALATQVKTIDGVLLGHGASAKLEKILRESAAAAHTETPAAEYAIRFLCLLVEKNSFRYVNLLLKKIEQDLDARNGILNTVVEAAAPVDSSLEEKLKLMIKEKTGAAGVRMKTAVRPELLGGYILRIGSHYIDASLKGQLESMAAHLGADTGGRNG